MSNPVSYGVVGGLGGWVGGWVGVGGGGMGVCGAELEESKERSSSGQHGKRTER
jgi:hypothetical protein